MCINPIKYCCQFNRPQPGNNQDWVIHKPTGRTFNHLTCDSNRTLRKKFLLISTFQIVHGIFLRFPIKIFNFLACEFVFRGISQAQCKYKVLQVKAHKQSRRIQRLAFSIILTKELIKEFAKEIANIALFPITLVALQFAAIVGVIAPQTGRLLFSEIERITTTQEDIKSIPCYFLAPCMQSREEFRRRNLYQLFFLQDTVQSESLYTSFRNEEHSLHYFLTLKKELISAGLSQDEQTEFTQLIQDIGSYGHQIQRDFTKNSDILDEINSRLRTLKENESSQELQIQYDGISAPLTTSIEHKSLQSLQTQYKQLLDKRETEIQAALNAMRETKQTLRQFAKNTSENLESAPVILEQLKVIRERCRFEEYLIT